MWNHADQWKVGFDYTLQQWGNTDYPAVYKRVDDERETYNVGGEYTNRSKLNLGMQYCYGEYSAGFGIPIVNGYNRRSFLNISGQWVKSSAKDLISENTFRLNIGFTFNEEWFRKWRMK